MDLPNGYPVPDGLTRPFTMRTYAEALVKALNGAAVETGKPALPSAIRVRSTGGDPAVLAAVVRGRVAESVPVETLRRVRVPELVLNGRADLADRAVGRLVEIIPGARPTACDGDHPATPRYPSFQQAAVDIFAARWPARGAAVPGRASGSENRQSSIGSVGQDSGRMPG